MRDENSWKYTHNTHTWRFELFETGDKQEKNITLKNIKNTCKLKKNVLGDNRKKCDAINILWKIPRHDIYIFNKFIITRKCWCHAGQQLINQYIC